MFQTDRGALKLKELFLFIKLLMWLILFRNLTSDQVWSERLHDSLKHSTSSDFILVDNYLYICFDSI